MKTRLFSCAAGVFLGLGQGLLAQPAPGTVLWICTPPDPISVACPAIAPDGTIYAAGAGWNGAPEALYAISPQGSIKWVFTNAVPGILVVGSPAIGQDGTIYFGDYNTNFFALNPDGTVKWTYGLPVPHCSSSPAIGVDGSLYFVVAGKLYALDSSGQVKWQHLVDYSPSENYQFSPVIGGDGTIYIPTWYGLLYAINPDGTERWQSQVGSYGGESVALAPDGTIYFAAVNSVYALSPAGGVLWMYGGGWYYQPGSPVLDQNGTVYFGAQGQLYSVTHAGAGGIHGQIGMNSWHFGGITTPAIDASGMIYFYSSNSLFAARSDGTVSWIFSGPDAGLAPYVRMDAYTPAIGPNGTIYAGFRFALYAIQGSGTPLGATGWPMYRQNLRHTGKVEKPSLAPPKPRVDHNFDLQLFGEMGQPYTVQSTTNFLDWSFVTNFVATNLPMSVTDLTASNAPARFYRASTP